MLDVKKLLTKMLTRIDNMYPVGSIYISTSSVSPATIFGGTWQRIQGRFLLGADSTYTAGSTGGEATHTLTVSEMPSHSHNYAKASGTGLQVASGSAAWVLGNPTDATITTSSAGSGQAHNNMPPYIAVYMWERTA